MAWACNWKVGVDAFNEVYHVQGIHPELLSFTDDVDCPVDILGRHSRFIFRDDLRSPVLPPVRPTPFTFRVGSPSPRWTDDLARREGYPDRHQITPMMR